MAQVKSTLATAAGGSANPSISLTPASDQHSSSSSSHHLSSTLSQHFSTRASVDSESDYQSVSATTPSGTPSRPLSRTSSTMSAVSTVATKDGVEGTRLKKFHDPTSWMPRDNTAMDDDMADRESVTSMSTEESSTPPPPNIPSAPPVTLNEKIRLLRTGSVSGKQ